MSQDWKIMFCDEVTQANHGKINLIGCILFSPLYISSEDYWLVSNLVIQGNIKKRYAGQDFYLKIDNEYEDGTIAPGQKMKIHTVPNFELETIPGFQSIPINIMLKKEGQILISIYIGKRLIHKEIFKIEYGNSPSTRVFGRIGTSGLISSEQRDIKVSDLIRGADRDLIIIDQYLPQEDLIDLLKEAEKNTKIKVLTGFNYKESYKNTKLKEFGHDNVEVRFSNLFHDRYIIVNTTEAYKFGYSLKDLYKGRISSYSKIITKTEYESTLTSFNKEWGKSNTI